MIDPQSRVWGPGVQTSPTCLLPKTTPICTKLPYCLFVTYLRFNKQNDDDQTIN